MKIVKFKKDHGEFKKGQQVKLNDATVAEILKADKDALEVVESKGGEA